MKNSPSLLILTDPYRSTLNCLFFLNVGCLAMDSTMIHRLRFLESSNDSEVSLYAAILHKWGNCSRSIQPTCFACSSLLDSHKCTKVQHYRSPCNSSLDFRIKICRTDCLWILPNSYFVNGENQVELPNSDQDFCSNCILFPPVHLWLSF